MHGQRAELQPAALLFGATSAWSWRREWHPRSSRSAAARLCYSATPASTGTRARTWNLRVQIPTRYRFHHPCARDYPRGVAAPRRHSSPTSVRATHTITARTKYSHACARDSTRSTAALFPSWVFSCERAWAIATDQLIGGKSQPGQKRKVWRLARPLQKLLMWKGFTR